MKLWPVGGAVRTVRVPGGAVIIDLGLASNAEPVWLDANWWAERGTVTPVSEGRGSAWFISADTRELVLRHYRRGGLMARVSVDRYLWRGAAATRAFAEWHLLHTLRHNGLPVPVPVAARYLRRGATYSADILLERIVGARSLGDWLRETPLPFDCWVAVGRVIASFHVAGVCHADLNCRNVLVSDDGEISLIDFDRARLRRPGLWSDDNLARLYRSLDKLACDLPQDRFMPADWSALLDGYFAVRSEDEQLRQRREDEQRLAALLK